jgi:non-specific serine/threonine protein kinase
VALKFLRDEVLETGAGLERLRREARAASALNHPHICTIHDVELLGGRPFLVMERLEGATLADRLRGGPLPVPELLDLALQLAQALSAAHEKGVVHRDLKPGNIFVTRDGRAKIVDFGIALLHRPVTGLTTSVLGLRNALLDDVTEHPAAAEFVLGTLPYMAPEQVCQATVDARADLFSFGAVLYEMATGRRAFDGSTRNEVLGAVLDPAPMPPSRFEPGLPREMDDIILKALRKQPHDRHPTAREMHALLLGIREKDGARGLPSVGGSVVEGPPRRLGSLAVMPVRALSTDVEGELLADGATDAIIASLARIRDVRVLSLTSVMGYKGASGRLPDIARELGVEGVVEGCLLTTGTRVRITARLFRTADDCFVWSRLFEGDRRDVLGLQDQLARALTRKVRAAAATHRRSRPACYGLPSDPVGGSRPSPNLLS